MENKGPLDGERGAREFSQQETEQRPLETPNQGKDEHGVLEETSVPGLERTLFSTPKSDLGQTDWVSDATHPSPAPGSTCGQFRLITVAGKGAQGVVWEAHDELLERPVALKFLPEQLAANPEAQVVRAAGP